MQLNKQQVEAVKFKDGACGVIASAGSGKTKVLTERVKNLVDVHNIKEKDILTISFTNKTATELKNKLNKMGYHDITVSTFHGICGRILDKAGSYISPKNLIKDWHIENEFKRINQKANVPEILSYISYQKNYMRMPNDEFVHKESNYSEEELRQFYHTYENFKKKKRLCDFDDFLLECYKLLKEKPELGQWLYVSVDEHQDSNLIQNELLKLLCPSGNLFVVFDPRQAIYSFRAGNLEYAMNFEKEWNATILNLDINYRSARNIVNAANDFIRPYFSHFNHYKDAIPNSTEDGLITLHTYDTRDDEAVKVADQIEKLIEEGEKLSEIAVLYRLNAHAAHIENELRSRDIEYEINSSDSFFKKKEINAIMSYLRLINNHQDDAAFEQIWKLRQDLLKYFKNEILNNLREQSAKNGLSLYENFLDYKFDAKWHYEKKNQFEQNISRLKMQMERNIGIKSLIDNVIKLFKLQKYIYDSYIDKDEIDERLKNMNILKGFVKTENLEEFINYVYGTSTSKKAKKNSVKLMSLHSSKGLEWNNCFLVGVEEKKLPHEKSSIDEEARLWYVGVTRSKKNLHISQIGEGSIFIDEYFGDMVN
ncbi:ATP-dependent helicase [Niallia alba]|uniref:ATP-dependent helicase n=1 Tax=Niallia alba TaxID=2729105 RepID=UPI002E1A8B93|nr:ATP-dependent helicase [Niallia alba]